MNTPTATTTLTPADGGHTCHRRDCYAEAAWLLVVATDEDGTEWTTAVCPDHRPA